MEMIVSLASLMTICYPIISAVPLVGQSDLTNTILPGPIAINILRDYVSTEGGVHKIHTDRATWNGARNICLNETAQLVVIETAVEEAMLLRHLKVNNVKSAWIGDHMLEKKQWTKITGQGLETFDKLHSKKGEPNGTLAGERCVAMNLAEMNDLACKTEMAFICEKSSLDEMIDIRSKSK